MKEKFKKYYRPWLVASIFIMGTIAVPRMFGEHRHRVLSLFGLSVFVSGMVLMTLGVGGIYHYYGEKAGPKRKKKLFIKLGQRKLEDLGLKPDIENQCYAGHFKKYYLTLTPDSNLEEYDILRISAFILHKDSQGDTLNNLAKKYEFDAGESVSFFTHKMKLPFGTIPKLDKIQKEVETFIDDLRFKNIEPLTVTIE
jgi:hypothetical protein